MKYLIKVNTESEIQQALNNDVLGKPYLALIESENRIDWNSKEKEDTDYSKKYLTFRITENGNIVWKKRFTGMDKTVYYSKDNGGTWTQIKATVSAETGTIPVVSGDKVLFKGTNSAYGDLTNPTLLSASTCGFELEGNIMSLVNGDSFIGKTTLSANYTFMRLFASCTKLTSIENLVLPATTLKNGCYWAMFNGSKNIIGKAPELPAPTLLTSCYSSMFQGCSKVNYIKCLATNATGTSYTNIWVSGVAGSGTFVKKEGVTWSRGESGIPNNWTIVDA